MTPLTILFLCLLLLATTVLLYLSYRQSTHVRAHRGAVPTDFAAVITLEQHRHAADYSNAKSRLERVDLVLSLLITLVWTLGGGITALQQWAAAVVGSWGTLAADVVLIVAFLLISTLVGIPLALYRTFVVEVRFGFNKTTPRIFLTDLLISTALTLVIGGPLIALFLWVVAQAGTSWWLWGWGLLLVFQLVGIWVFPTFIAPLFNRFTPLDDAELQHRIEGLLARTGYCAAGLYVMDASRRSGHGNAYFTGLGNAKRIVFYDTLLTQLDHAQIEAVLAHEIGHDKRHHIPQMIAGFAVLSLIGFAVVGWLMTQPAVWAAIGVADAGMGSRLLALLLVLPACTFFVDPLVAWRSRVAEFEADAYAVAQTSADAMAAALVSIYRENAGTLTPDPWYAAWHYSHPPASERVGHIRRSAS